MTTLRSVIAPLASTVRTAGIVYIVVQIAIWHSFYAADQWRLAGPAVAVAWGATVVVRLRRRWPTPVLAEVDSAVYMALALGAQGCVPPQVRDDLFGWLVISMSGQLIVPAWYAPGVLSPLLTLLAPAAYWVGAALQPVADRRTATGPTIILLVIGLCVHGLARRELYRRAAAADQAVAEAALSAGEQYAILSRNIERREHERLLHDTVLNTLTALARPRSDDAGTAVSRCRRDMALIEDALADPDDGTGRPSGDLVGQVLTVVADLCGRGLTVHLDIDIDDEGVPAVPARVAGAISNATREALSNVAAHAGTGEAWVRIRLLGDAQAPCRLQVIVRDRGAGFDPGRVDQGRLGLRRSIAERAADCGGQASVRSAPGQGTEVSLSWPASARPGEPGLAPLVPADRAAGALAQESP